MTEFCGWPCCNAPILNIPLVATTHGKTLTIFKATGLTHFQTYEFTDHPDYGGGISFESLTWPNPPNLQDYWAWWLRSCKFDKNGDIYVAYTFRSLKDGTDRKQTFGVFKLKFRNPTQEELQEDSEDRGKKWRFEWATDIGALWFSTTFTLGQFGPQSWNFCYNRQSGGEVKIDNAGSIFIEHPESSLSLLDSTVSTAVPASERRWLTCLDSDGNIVHQYGDQNTSVAYPGGPGNGGNVIPPLSNAVGYRFNQTQGGPIYELDNRGGFLICARSSGASHQTAGPLQVAPYLIRMNYAGVFSSRCYARIATGSQPETITPPSYFIGLPWSVEQSINGFLADTWHSTVPVRNRNGYVFCGTGYGCREFNTIYCEVDGQGIAAYLYKRIADTGETILQSDFYYGTIGSTVNPDMRGYYTCMRRGGEGIVSVQPYRLDWIQHSRFGIPISNPMTYESTRIICYKGDSWNNLVALVHDNMDIDAYTRYVPSITLWNPKEKAYKYLTIHQLPSFDVAYAAYRTTLADVDEEDLQSTIRDSLGRTLISNVKFNRESGNLYVLWSANHDVSDEEASIDDPPYHVNHRLYEIDPNTGDIHNTALELGYWFHNGVTGTNLQNAIGENGKGASYGLDFYTPRENPATPKFISPNYGPFETPEALE